MTYLVVVEGVSDKGVVEAIAKKLGVNIEVHLMRGNNPDKAARIINSTLEVNQYSKVVILKDQHRYPEDKIKELLNKALSKVNHPRKYGVIVKKAIEAWILAGLGVNSPEDINEPDNYLNEILKREGRGYYVKSLRRAKELMMNADLSQATSRSPSLRKFINVLRDPL